VLSTIRVSGGQSKRLKRSLRSKCSGVLATGTAAEAAGPHQPTVQPSCVQFPRIPTTGSAATATTEITAATNTTTTAEITAATTTTTTTAITTTATNAAATATAKS